MGGRLMMEIDKVAIAILLLATIQLAMVMLT